MSQKVRESNFELLRIVAILFITMHHLLINGIDLCGYNCNFVLNLNSSIAVILNSLIVGGKFVPFDFRLVWNKNNYQRNCKIGCRLFFLWADCLFAKRVICRC